MILMDILNYCFVLSITPSHYSHITQLKYLTFRIFLESFEIKSGRPPQIIKPNHKAFSQQYIFGKKKKKKRGTVLNLKYLRLAKILQNPKF